MSETPHPNRIKEARKQAGRTARWLAAQLGINPSYLSKIEQGRRPLRLEMMDDIAAALDIHPSELLTEAPRPASIPLEGLLRFGALERPDIRKSNLRFEFSAATHLAVEVGEAAPGADFRAGDMLICELRDDPSQAIGRLALVDIQDGPTVLGRIAAGRRPDRYSIATESTIHYDVAIVRTAVVGHLLRGIVKK